MVLFNPIPVIPALPNDLGTHIEIQECAVIEKL